MVIIVSIHFSIHPKLLKIMKKNSILFNIDISTGTQPEPGSLLIAEPFLHEDYFNHAVISLIDYEKGGTAMGVVLNNPTDYKLQELIEGITIEQPIPVFCGGPMSDDRLYFLHTLGDLVPDTRELSPGLWVGGDFGAIASIVNDGYPIDGNIRFFIGYSGWSERQLDNEISEKVWAVTTPADPHQMLRAKGDDLWHSSVRKLGADFRGWLYHPQNVMSN